MATSDGPPQQVRLPPASEPDFALLFSSNPLPMWVYDVETLQLVSANDAAFEISGYVPNDLPALTPKSLVVARDQERVDEALRSGRSPRGLRYGDHWQLRTKAGVAVDVETTSHALQWRGRDSVLLVTIDISKRVEVERSLARAHRLNDALAQVNHEIVHQRDEQVLLERFCAIAVGPGGMHVASFGVIEGEVLRSRAAATGEGPAGAPDIPLRVDDARGHGPSATAAREGHTVVSQDLLGDAGSVAWRDTVRTQGVASCGAFPVMRAGRQWGVLSLYHSEPGAFDDGVVRLATQLARDAGFGLDRIDAQVRQAALIERDAQFRTFFEVSTVGLATVSADHRFLEVNDALCRIHGCSADELRKRPWRELTHPDDIAESVEKNREVDSGASEGFAIDKRYVRKDGSLIPVHIAVRAIRDGAGQVQSYAVVVIDLTERVRAEEALRKSEAQLQRLLESSPTVLYSLRVDGDGLVLTWISGNLQRILGHPVSAASADWWFAHVHEDDRAAAADNRMLFATGARQHTYRFRSGAGDLRWVHDDQRLITHPDGTREVIGVWQDVTATRLAEDRERDFETQRRQTQKLEALGTLAGGVAHEINNPINGVMNYAELLRRAAVPGSTEAEYAQEILHETERVAAIVRNLVQFARHDRRPLAPARLEDIVEATLGLVRTVLKHDQIALVVELPAGLPGLHCRSQQLQQVVMNLLSNARDALNQRFPGAHPDKRIEVKGSAFSRDGRRWVRLRVEDRGFGIPPELAARVFDPFFTTRSRDQRSGLGLSVSHSITKDHGGTLTFESMPGQGTRFALELPGEVT